MKILTETLKQVNIHAQEVSPNECCGILLSEHSNIITRILRADNVYPNLKQGYQIGHKAHLAALELEFLKQAQIMGYYHSHPNCKPKPSLIDLEKAIEEINYLIISPSLNPGYFAWKIIDNVLVPKEIEVIKKDFSVLQGFYRNKRRCKN